MRHSVRQLVLALILGTAWLALGGNRAEASYVSTADLSDAALAAVLGTSESGMAGAAGPSDSLSSGDATYHRSTDSLARFAHLFRKAWHIGLHGSTGSTTNGSSVNGPSGQQIGAFSRYEFAPPKVVCFLPPEVGISHPFSIASRLFRPPRLGA